MTNAYECTTQPQRSQAADPLRTRDFRLLVAGLGISLFANLMLRFAMSMWVLDETGSAAAFASILTASILPTILLSPLGGVMADRTNRRTVMVALDALSAVTVLVCAAIFSSAGFNLAAIAVMQVALAVLDAMETPTVQAALPQMFRSHGEDVMRRAMAVVNVVNQTSTLVPAVLGGVLYAVAPWLPFAVASLMYAISGVSAAQLRVDEHVRDMVTTDRKSKRPDTASQAGCTSDAAVAPDADATAESAHTSFFEDFIEGWRWTLRRHTLLAICVIAALVNFGLNGVFAAVNLQLVSTHVDSVRLGFINTVMGVGMLIGAVIAARVCEPVHMGTGLVVLSVTSLLTLLPMLFSSDYLVILASSLVVGLPIPTINSLLMGFVFAKVPSEMQGRVGSASGMLSMIPTLFCSALAGSLLPRIGFGATIGLFLAVLAVNVVIALLMPSIRSLPAADHWDDSSL